MGERLLSWAWWVPSRNLGVLLTGTFYDWGMDTTKGNLAVEDVWTKAYREDWTYAQAYAELEKLSKTPSYEEALNLQILEAFVVEFYDPDREGCPREKEERI